MDDWEKLKYNETHRLLKWIRGNRDDWEDICGLSGKALEPKTYIRYLETLRDEKFYDVIVAFLTIHHEIYHVGDFMRELALQKLDEEWIAGIGIRGVEFFLEEARKEML